MNYFLCLLELQASHAIHRNRTRVLLWYLSQATAYNQEISPPHWPFATLVPFLRFVSRTSTACNKKRAERLP
jgi:hypothetical protein